MNTMLNRYMKKTALLSMCLLSLYFSGCVEMNGDETGGRLEGFQNTKGERIAEIIQDKDLNELKDFLDSDTSGINAIGKDGMTLLMWAVKSGNFDIARELLKAGADPDIKSSTGKTAVFYATEAQWGDVDNIHDRKFIDLLVEFGADVNLVYTGSGTLIHYGTSPLIHAASRSLEKVKALMDGGAKKNYKTDRNWTAANQALLNEMVDIAHYLIVKEKADITQPYYYKDLSDGTLNKDDPREPVGLLKKWVYELNSDKHDKKMEIVQEFTRQGVDYWSYKPDQNTLKHIKKLYPDNWQEYLNKY